MVTSFGDFLVGLKEARFTFDVIWQAIVSFFGAVWENPDISAIWGGLTSVFGPIYVPFMIFVTIAALVMAFFGRRLMGVIKFSGFFVLGFILGAQLLGPLLPDAVNIPGWLVGTVTALIAAVLYRFLYIILYVSIAGYGMYVLTYYGFFLAPDATYSGGRGIMCLVAALVAIIIALCFRKYVEMLGTAILGAWLAVLAFAYNVYNFTEWQMFDGVEWLAILIPTVVIAMLGALLQIKTRRRY